ncbi:MAG: sensor histidine kinase, partial [Myxococcota bacterium]
AGAVPVRAWPVRDSAGELTGAVALLAADRSVARVLAQKEKQLAILRSVGTAANAAEDHDEALRVALRTVCEVTGWSVGTAQIVCDMPPRFVASLVHHADDPERYAPFIEATRRVSLGLTEGLPGRVLQTRGPVYTRAIHQDRSFLRAGPALAVGLHDALAFPIRMRDDIVGVFELFSPGHPPPTPELRDVLLQVGAQLGRVVERERARARENFVRAVLDAVGDPIFVKDRSFRWVLLNRAHDDLVGFPREVMIGKTDHDFFPKEQAEFFRRKDIEMFSSEARVSIEEEPITDASGKVHWLATTKVPLRDEQGRVTHLVGIIHDITRLKEAEEALLRRNEELAAEVRERTLAVERLDATNRELEGFCYTVSHDLRAPLRAIDGYSRLVQEDSAHLLPPATIHTLERVRVNVRRMSDLIDDLLALSRVSRVPLEREEVDLAPLAREVVADLARQEPGRRVHLVVDEPLVACVDRRLARVLFENLLGNAWKFTGNRQQAVIEVGVRNGAWFVRDNGAGFDMDFAANLFKPFTRLHRHEEFPGTGVGLASVKRVVERHGGRVWAEGAVDRGATVWFTLGPR